MRVLLLNDYGTPTGGAEIRVLALRDALRAHGHDARLFTSSARPAPVASRADYECRGTTSRWRTLLQSANPFAWWALRRVLAEFRPDVVHARIFLTQLSPLILPLLRDVPSIYHVVWYRAICPLGTKRLPDGASCHTPPGAVCLRSGCVPRRDWLPLMFQMQLWRGWRASFDAIVANSDAGRQRLLAEGIGPVDVIHNGLPVPPERPPLADPPRVVFAGRLVPEKGAAWLLRAFARVASEVPGARLELAGDGPERPRLAGLARELGVERTVELPGHLDRDALEARFAGAWVQAVPSLWEEPFGNVALEGMLRGTAVVATRSGGLPELVEDGRTGLLVEPGDEAGLAAALSRLLRDRALAERMGRAGRASAAERFSEDACVEKFLDLYERLRSVRR